MNFDQFGFHPLINSALVRDGFSEPTPIQQQAIPFVLQGRDVLGLAQTGTGKTAAFVLPILQRLLSAHDGHPRALILAPTRELAQQIEDVIRETAQGMHIGSTTVYGGVSMEKQVRALRGGADIVVACPGRLLDHLRCGSIDVTRLEVLVLDEADRMFDMGFLPAIRQIIKALPPRRQNLLFSATMPADVRRLSGEVLTRPVVVEVERIAPVATVSHAIYPVASHAKPALLVELLRTIDRESVLVFTRTKHRAKKVAQQLLQSGFAASSIQGNLSQNRRQAALDGFRSGKYQVLVATDIAARGIDIDTISHVINYDMPDTPEAYIHRVGRTGRAKRTGDAFTLTTSEDAAMVRTIERLLGHRLERAQAPVVAGQKSELAPPSRQTGRAPSRRARFNRSAAQHRPPCRG